MGHRPHPGPPYDRVSGEPAAPSAAGAVVPAVTAGPEGEEGSYKATPLSLSGDWQVGWGSAGGTWRSRSSSAATTPASATGPPFLGLLPEDQPAPRPGPPRARGPAD
ncbi:hypothetical protein [Nonomuraea sp. LPB2021202275-12-8]|uniref:hypothetical protein n=1 Tax=Nonomuraea sp. LPB2021202275-12-8 TaxID=3120159 RepID=UPI00300C6633